MVRHCANLVGYKTLSKVCYISSVVNVFYHGISAIYSHFKCSRLFEYSLENSSTGILCLDEATKLCDKNVNHSCLF